MSLSAVNGCPGVPAATPPPDHGNYRGNEPYRAQRLSPLWGHHQSNGGSEDRPEREREGDGGGDVQHPPVDADPVVPGNVRGSFPQLLGGGGRTVLLAVDGALRALPGAQITQRRGTLPPRPVGMPMSSGSAIGRSLSFSRAGGEPGRWKQRCPWSTPRPPHLGRSFDRPAFHGFTLHTTSHAAGIYTAADRAIIMK